MELNYSLRFKNYMRVAVISTFFIFMSGGYANAATLYMGSNEKYTNLQAALSAMKAGDTLIIRDGTYSGTNNVITSNIHPPISSTTWTIIKAENPGSVILEAKGVGAPINFVSGANQNNHWIFDGIVFKNSSSDCVFIGRSSYVKFLRCGFVDALSSAQGDGFSSHTCSYILLEDCYFYGEMRYGVQYYRTNNSIIRRCVARHDRGNFVYQVGFQVYGSSNVEVQNCIVIDSDLREHYLNTDASGPASQLFAFKVPQESGGNINFSGCIALNNEMDFAFIQAGTASLTNCVGWNINGHGVCSRSTGRVEMNHLTLGKISGYGTTGDGAEKSIWNSLIYQCGSIGLRNSGGKTTSDYNLLHNNVNYSGVTPGSNDIVSVGDPLPSISSQPRKVGATITNKIGRSGTLWGEDGYNLTTTESLWPFPYEDIIRSKMREYSGGGVIGSRGFCAENQTLTNYVWDYLDSAIMSSPTLHQQISIPTGVKINIAD